VSFTVHARVSLRALSYQHGSILSALEQGLSLLTAGMSDVRIVDAGGRSHSPMALYAQLYAPRVVAEPAIEIDVADLPLAA
jgi:signal recognition particle GTPase